MDGVPFQVFIFFFFSHNPLAYMDLNDLHCAFDVKADSAYIK